MLSRVYVSVLYRFVMTTITVYSSNFSMMRERGIYIHKQRHAQCRSRTQVVVQMRFEIGDGTSPNNGYTMKAQQLKRF
jgi:hypothetical protein